MASGSDFKKGFWTKEEDRLLKQHIQLHGEGHWSTIPKTTGLLRCGRSCRLRWMNHLRPNIKRGKFSQDEEELIIRLQKLLGNRWSLIAGRMPGRTDNEVKNYWYSRLKHRVVGNKVTRPSVTRLTDKPNNLAKSLPIVIESAKTAAIRDGTCREAQGQDIILNVGEENEQFESHAIERNGIPSYLFASVGDELSPCNLYLFEESISLLDFCFEQQNVIEQWL